MTIEHIWTEIPTRARERLWRCDTCGTMTVTLASESPSSTDRFYHGDSIASHGKGFSCDEIIAWAVMDS